MKYKYEINSYARSVAQIERLEHCAQSLERIADALERAFPEPKEIKPVDKKLLVEAVLNTPEMSGKELDAYEKEKIKIKNDADVEIQRALEEMMKNTTIDTEHD